MCAMRFRHEVSPGKPSGVQGTVPLVGAELERLLADRIRAGIDAEHGVGVAWLEGNR